MNFLLRLALFPVVLLLLPILLFIITVTYLIGAGRFILTGDFTNG